VSRYEYLDARIQLEQVIAQDLKAAFEKRGFWVKHNGTADSVAPAGVPDIEVWDSFTVLTFEVTKRKGAQQDAELNSIRDHLRQVKESNPEKKCLCVFVSPETSRRMLDGILDYNRQRESEGKVDLRILPLCFDTLEFYLDRLIENDAALYPVSDFLEIFGYFNYFIDDLRIKKLLVQKVFPFETGLMQAIEQEEVEHDQFTLECLIRDLMKTEDYMRQNGIAVGHAAIDTLIYLVFLKLYEEKREIQGRTNRLRSPEAFEDYRQDSVDEPTRNAKRAIHKLFRDVAVEAEFVSSGMFTEGDKLPDSVNDDFILDYIIPVFSKYSFLGTKIDALGAVYEVLALRAEKDVKVGQFFTPENVVRFMVKLAELDPQDYVLDPACGTGRFLIYAMDDMVRKAEASSVRNKPSVIRHIRLCQLFGVDIDNRIAKIAKMNMWIHGDGKSNIFGGPGCNGLVLHKHRFDGEKTFDNAFDVVLTNPPLGVLNYQVIRFTDEPDADSPQKKLERMPVLPRKNLTLEKFSLAEKRLAEHRLEYRALEQKKTELEEKDVVQEWIRLGAGEPAQKENERGRELRSDETVREYRNVCSALERKRRAIEQNKKQVAELEARLRAGDVEWEVAGNTMKGGALFVAAIWHYLKEDTGKSELPEWRGGKVLIVLDEGVLNTDDYKEVREFIRRRFYIKAVISLTRDAFVPISKTATKTSILYAVKKTDPDAVQREPIFYAHVDKVGMDTKGRACPNHLDVVLEKYFDFKNKVLNAYAGLEFRKEMFLKQGFEGGFQGPSSTDSYFFKTGSEKRSLWFVVFPDEVTDRLHYLFFHPRCKELDELRRRYRTVQLGEICREPIVRGEQPDYDELGTVTVLRTVDLKNGYIDYANAPKVSEEFYNSHPSARVQKGDVLVASTGYVSMGKVDVYDRDEPAVVDGHIAIVRVNSDHDPYFVAYYLRSRFGQLQFEKWFSGSSGQIELQPHDLGKFVVPASGAGGIPLSEQSRIASVVTEQLEQARSLEQLATAKRQGARTKFEKEMLLR